MKEYKSLTEFIENTNLGITFVASHEKFTATFEKQYHTWQVKFENEHTRIIEEVISPTNKLHEPSFIDLIYEICVCISAYNMSRAEWDKKYKSDDIAYHRMISRSKRFQDLKIDSNVVNKISSYNHSPKWKLWDPQNI